MASGTARSASGAFIGTGAEKTVVVGFTPRFVHLVNASDPDQVFAWASMPDDTAIESDAGTVTFESSGGITFTTTGFTIASDSVCNISTEQMYWFAIEM